MQRQNMKLEAGEALDQADIRKAAAFLLDGTAADEEKGRFLEALSRKGETPGEIAGFVTTFLEYSVDPGLDGIELAGPTIDVCGTGGDKLDLFNVSTTAMFVVAAAGAVVVKHGNRGITSKSGGADVLEALGVRIDLPMERFHVCLAESGVGFMFAPMMHPAFKAVAGVRTMLARRGVRTIFNLIGPLLNPARPKCQLVGVFAEELVPAFAEIMVKLGRESAWVAHGKTADGRPVDEVSLMGSTRIRVAGREREMLLEPEEFGLKRVEPGELAGGDAKVNAAILEAVLSGMERGAKRDMVLLNAGAAITCAGIAPDMSRGVALAREMIEGGAALERLRLLQYLAR